MVNPQKHVKQGLVRELASGVTEEHFWATFVQCLTCKAVVFRETYGANHKCDIEEPNRQRYTPYSRTPTRRGPTATRPRATGARLCRTYAFSIPSTPAELAESEELHEEVEVSTQVLEDPTDVNSDPTDSSDDLLVFSSDVDLPTIPQILAGLA